MLNDSKNHCNQVRTNFSYKINKGQRYYITIKMRNAHGQFVPVNILADSGNDITILTKRTARSLGYDTNKMPNASSFHVKGINGDSAEFKEIMTDVILGNVPLRIPVGLATRDQDLSDNLLGRTGVVDSGMVALAFDDDSVDIIDKRYKSMKVSICGH